jgi:hypothetical protein
MKYYVGNLNSSYDCNKQEGKENEKFSSKWPIKTDDDSLENGLKGL